MDGAHRHLHCYRMAGRVILDMKFLRDFTQPDLTLSNPNEYSFAGRPEVERIVSNMKKWRTRAFSSSALSDMRKLLLGGKQCLLSFTKHQLTPIGPERLEKGGSILALPSKLQPNQSHLK